MQGMKRELFSAHAPTSSRSAYAAELLKKEGEEFIEAVYAALLSRAADVSGKKQYLQRLATGTSKVQVLHEIFTSPECQTNGNQLFGLSEAVAPESLSSASAHFALDVPHEPGQITCAEDLLRYDGRLLIEYAFITLLKRPADAEGAKYYLERLTNGTAKSQIVYEIFTSPECFESGAGLPGVREAFLSENGSSFDDEAVTRKRYKSNVAVNAADLVQRNSSEFVECAYLTLLKRSPDAAGFRHSLLRLRSGVAKVEILADIVLSNEGRAAAVNVPGLSWLVSAHRLSRWPVIGRVVRLFAKVESGAASESRIRCIEQRVLASEERLGVLAGSVARHWAQSRQMREIGSRIDTDVKRLNEAVMSTRMETSVRLNRLELKLNFDEQFVRDVFQASAREERLQKPMPSTPPNSYMCSADGKIYDLTELRKTNSEYLGFIKDSGLFDSQFYVSNYAVDDVFLAEPELHFVLFGETNGWQPNPKFQPRLYRALYPHIATESGKPFLHYLSANMRELKAIQAAKRTKLHLPVPSLGVRSIAKSNQVAIYAHLHCVRLWPELARAIARLTSPFDLFVVIVDLGMPLRTIMDDIKVRFPQALISVFPNHGRDTFPFVHMLGEGLFESYDLVGKIHSKNSPYRFEGVIWRKHLMDGVLPDSNAGELVRKLLNSKDVGISVAEGQILEGDEWWGSNKLTVAQLLQRAQIHISMENLRFPAGSMYWIKKPILNLIRGMQLTVEDFEVETGQLEGTTAHAFERALGFLAVAANRTIVHSSELSKVNPNQVTEAAE